MFVFAFASLYVICAVLLLAVLIQDRRNGASRGGGRRSPEPRAAHEFVFRTQA